MPGAAFLQILQSVCTRPAFFEHRGAPVVTGCQKSVRCWHSRCPLTAALEAVMAQGDTSNGKTIHKLRLVRGKVQRTDTKRPSGCHLKAKPFVRAESL